MDKNRNRLVNHILTLEAKYEHLIFGSTRHANDLFYLACMSDEELKRRSDELDTQYKQPKKLTEQLYG